jgi:hypothetical protein
VSNSDTFCAAAFFFFQSILNLYDIFDFFLRAMLRHLVNIHYKPVCRAGRSFFSGGLPTAHASRPIAYEYLPANAEWRVAYFIGLTFTLGLRRVSVYIGGFGLLIGLYIFSLPQSHRSPGSKLLPQ